MILSSDAALDLSYKSINASLCLFTQELSPSVLYATYSQVDVFRITENGYNYRVVLLKY